MKPTNLIRCVAATLAASALLSAQSAPAAAPQPGPAAPKARSDARTSDRMQVRLAEVIAMLEEDDLSPEQRAQAKRKLEEIVAKLRETPPPTPPSPASVPAPATGVTAAPRAPRAERTPTTETVMVAPQEPGSAPSRRVLRVQGHEDGAPLVVRDGEGGILKVAKPVEGVRGVYRVDSADGVTIVQQDPSPKAAGAKEAKEGKEGKEVEKLQAEAKKLRAEAEAMRAKIRELADRAGDDRAAEAKKLTTARALLDRTRADAADAAKAADGALAHTRARAAEAEVQAKRAHDEAHEVHARADEERARNYPARTSAPSAEGRPVEVAPPPSRGRSREAADGDAEIKKLMQDMRDEMRAIRELLQQMRKQAQTWPAQRGLGGDDNQLGQASGQSPFAARNRYGSSDVAPSPRQDVWRGSFGGTDGTSGQDAGSGKGPAFGQFPKLQWSGNDEEGGKPRFWGYGQNRANAQPGTERAK